MFILQEFGVLLGGLSDCEELVGVTWMVSDCEELKYGIVHVMKFTSVHARRRRVVYFREKT